MSDDEDDVKITMATLRETDQLARRSPIAERRREIHQNALEDKAYAVGWESCCSRTGKTDARLLSFSMRATLSILTLGFAAVQLVRAEPCDKLVSWYCSIITFVLGCWMGANNDTKTAPAKK